MKPSLLWIASAVIGQIAVGYCAEFSARQFHFFWNRILNDKPLPAITEFAFFALPLIPYIVTVLLLIGPFVPILRTRIEIFVFGIILIELLIMAFLMMTLSYPSLTIFYGFAKAA